MRGEKFHLFSCTPSAIKDALEDVMGAVPGKVDARETRTDFNVAELFMVCAMMFD
jgi:hypothetical protein